MKKKGLFGLMAALPLAAVLYTSINVPGLAAFSSGTEEWGHYNAVDPTFTSKGMKEFWISCTTHNIVFTKPSSSNIVERGTVSQSFVDALSSTDSRLLPKYKKIYDFEDGVVPYEFGKGTNVSSLSIDETGGTRGSKCLKASISGSDYFMGFSKAYLDAAFADSSVNSIKFDAKGTAASSNFRHNTHFGRTDTLISNPFESSSGIDTNWKTFYWTRGMYEEWRDNSTFIKGGGYSSGNSIWIDNIELTERRYDSVRFDVSYQSFETGKINAKSSNNTSVRAGINNKEIMLVSGGGYNTVDYSYDMHTEGNRSIHFDKISGYIAIYLSGSYSSLEDEGIYFDIYTDFAINSTSSVPNITDGMNNPFGYVHNANKWTTYHFKKSQISTDGRFLILQGSTAGNVYIDNIRPASAYENFESDYALKAGQYSTCAGFEVTEDNYNTIRDSYKNYSVIINGTNISSSSMSYDHPENWHNRAFKTTFSSSSYCAIFLNPGFVQENFDAGIKLDVYCEKALGTGTSFATQVNANLNKWTTVTLQKDELYDPLKPGENVINGRIFGQNITGAGSIYIDNLRSANIQTVTTQTYEDVNFEEGEIAKTLVSSNARYAYTRNSKTEFVVQGGDSLITSVSLEASPLGRSGKSLKVTKGIGYVAFFFGTSTKAAMGDNDVLSFDCYSTIGVNSRTGANNFLSNNNGLFIGEDYTHPQGRWVTYKLKKTEIGDDGRFLIIQGSTAGDFYFDNFKVRSEKHYNDIGTYFPEPGGAFTVDLGFNIPEGTVVNIDNSPVYYKNNGDSSITIYSSSVDNGEHVMDIKVFTNAYSCKEYQYYFATYEQTASQKISLTLSYGSGAYQTISGLSDVRGVMCGQQTVAFDKSGSDLLIPDASLIELLDTVNGSKKSGSLRLIAFSGDKRSNVTALNYTITLSGDSTEKTGYTNYSSETFDLYAYSSTSAGSSRNLNYEEQLMEYKRSGLENIYEQLESIPVDISEGYFSNYHSNTNRNYQDLVRCDELGIGCVVADAYTNALCDQTSSIYNRSITLSSSTTVNFTSTTDLYNALYARYSLFASHPSLKQVVLCDEPRWNNLTPTCEVYKQARKVMNDLGRTDVVIGVNLLPISAGYGDTGIGTQVSGISYLTYNAAQKRYTTYHNYLKKWLDESGANYVQYDIYPLNTYAAEDDGDNSSNRSGVDKFNFLNIIAAADFCNSNNIELRVVTQTCTLPDRAEGTNTRIMSADDLRYCTNTLMGFGVKQISYFTYYARHTTGETFNQDGGFMKESWDYEEKTEKTTVWYDAQTINAEMTSFAKVVQNFSYVTCNFIKNGSYVDQGEAYSNADNYDKDNFKNFGDLSNCTIDNGYNMITAMKDSSSKYMYMVQNVCDPLYDQRLQTVTMTFSSGTYAQIWQNGQARIVYLSSSKLTLKLSSGNAAYVIVY